MTHTKSIRSYPINPSHILRIAVLALIALSFAGFLGGLSWLFELTIHFRFIYALSAAGLFVLGLFFKDRFAWVSSLCIFIFNAAWLIPLLFGGAKTQETSFQYSLLLFNNNFWNLNFERIRSEIEEAMPDIVIFQENDPAYVENIGLSKEIYPYTLRTNAEGVFGTAVISRYPITPVSMSLQTEYASRAIVAMIALPTRPIYLLAIHPPPPISSDTAAMRNLLLLETGALAARMPTPLIVAGDFNITPWSHVFLKAFGDTGLNAARNGFGLQPTWPVDWPALMRIPIDHILVSNEIVPLDFYTGPNLGSDHLPVWFDFGIAERFVGSLE